MTKPKPKVKMICDVCGDEFIAANKNCLYCHREGCKRVGMARRKWVLRHDGAPFPLSARRDPRDAQIIRLKKD